AFVVLYPHPVCAAVPWPGETWSAAVDLTGLNPAGWSSNLSGAYWNPVSRRLWVCLNGPALFWSLKEDGAGGFLIDQSYTGTGDLEGITQMDTDGGRVLMADEQARIVRAYQASDGAAAGTWFLDIIPDWGNSGPEGIAFIPDEWLARSLFVDGSGNLYPQSVHGAAGFGGILLVAVQYNGWVYAVDLKNDGTYTFVGRYLTSRTESCEVTFDASTGRLYILHNIDGNFIEITDLMSVVSGVDRKFVTIEEVQVPSGSNIEGFALTPALTPSRTVGDHWCFFTDDSNVGGALRWFSQLFPALTMASGDGQTASAGSALAVPPSVYARDAFGNPLSDFEVTFAVVSGGGSVTDLDRSTGANGLASVDAWVLGPVPSENLLTASGAGLNGSPQVFTATATAPMPAATVPGGMALAALLLLAGVCTIKKRKTRSERL
ncbi:MAG: hypothetical protein QG656_2253, partial [Candidatus Hydrogenedentes bacterium]|nr:hypothetical protein [Candidatus Hydrogenedentota bacterium]